MGWNDKAAIESDERIERMDRVGTLYGEITAATRAFLAAVAETDRHRDWAAEGFASCADWLAWKIGVTRNTANERVRVARALEELPLIADAMSRGEISFTKVRALTRAATPDNEAELLEFARAGSAANLERVVRGWKLLSRDDERRREQMRYASRYFSVVPDDDGMYVVRGRLAPEVAAALMRAVEAGCDALFATSTEAARTGKTPADAAQTEPRQRRADALGLVAERALAAGFQEGPVSGSRAERYQVVLHVQAATLTESEEPEQSELEDGTRVSAETARRLACDASRVDIHHVEVDPASPIHRVGRRTRTVPPSLRRALESRDRGCRFPGCGCRFTDAHHIKHWGDGGETTLRNLVLLCRRHHRHVHEGGFRVFADKNGQIVFFTPEGRAFADVAAPPALGERPAQQLIERNRATGVPLSDRLGAPRFKCDRDIPWSIEASAWEALERGSVDAEQPMEGAA